MKKLFSLIAIFASSTAMASTSEFNKQECVKSDLSQIQTLFTRYNDYATMPGSDYSIDLAGVKFPMLKMTKSQSKQVSANESLVWIVLQPTNLTDAGLYPKFLLNCKIDRNNTQAYFKQVCQLVQDKPHFGIQDMRIEVYSNRNSKNCKSDETNLYTTVKINTNSNEVAKIKIKVLEPAGPLAPVISDLFNEAVFFQNYFDYLYTEWFKTL
jgi:hypothetical protein